MRAWFAWLMRRVITEAGGHLACRRSRCGRPQIPGPATLCRRHTDEVLERKEKS